MPATARKRKKLKKRGTTPCDVCEDAGAKWVLVPRLFPDPELHAEVCGRCANALEKFQPGTYIRAGKSKVLTERHEQALKWAARRGSINPFGVYAMVEGIGELANVKFRRMTKSFAGAQWARSLVAAGMIVEVLPSQYQLTPEGEVKAERLLAAERP